MKSETSRSKAIPRSRHPPCKLEKQTNMCNDDWANNISGDGSVQYFGLLHHSSSLGSIPELNSPASHNTCQQQQQQQQQHRISPREFAQRYLPFSDQDGDDNDDEYPLFLGCLPIDQGTLMDEYLCDINANSMPSECGSGSDHLNHHCNAHTASVPAADELPEPDVMHSLLDSFPFEHNISSSLMDDGIGQYYDDTNNQHQQECSYSSSPPATLDIEDAATSRQYDELPNFFVRDAHNKIANRKTIMTTRENSFEMIASTAKPVPIATQACVYTPGTTTSGHFFSEKCVPTLSPIACAATKNASKLWVTTDIHSSSRFAEVAPRPSNFARPNDNKTPKRGRSFKSKILQSPKERRTYTPRKATSKATLPPSPPANDHIICTTSNMKRLVASFFEMDTKKQNWYGSMIRVRAERAALPFVDIVNEVLRELNEDGKGRPTDISSYPALCKRDLSMRPKACVMHES